MMEDVNGTMIKRRSSYVNNQTAAIGNDYRKRDDSSRECNKIKSRFVDPTEGHRRNNSSRDPDKNNEKVVNTSGDEPKKTAKKKLIDFGKSIQLIENHLLPNKGRSQERISKSDTNSSKKLREKNKEERNKLDSKRYEEKVTKNINISSKKLTSLDNSDGSFSTFIEKKYKNVNVSILSDCSISDYSFLSIDRKLRNVDLSNDKDSSLIADSSWCSTTDRKPRNSNMSTKRNSHSINDSGWYSFTDKEITKADESINRDCLSNKDSSWSSLGDTDCSRNFTTASPTLEENVHDSWSWYSDNLTVRSKGSKRTSVSSYLCSREKEEVESTSGDYPANDSSSWCSFTDRECRANSSSTWDEGRSSSRNSRSRHSLFSNCNGSYVSESDIMNGSTNGTHSPFSYDLEEVNADRKILKKIKKTRLYSSLVDIDSIYEAIEQRIMGRHDYWIHSRRRKIFILGDSHTRFLVFGLQHILPGFTIEAMCKPSAKSEQVITGMENTIGSLTKGDFLILLCGTNDMWGDSIGYAKTFIHYILNNLQNTNILLCNVPKNYSESKDSHVQDNIFEFNKHLNAIAKNVENINLVNLNRLKERLFFTKHGLHFNATGKIKICELISHKLVDVMDKINS